MRKNNKGTKVIISICVGIVILTIIAIIGLIIYDNMQYNVVAQEIAKINSEKVVDMEIKSKGKYETLEKSIKEYANEYYSNINTLKELYTLDELKSMLSIDNISKDGPNFDTTKTAISNFVTKQNEVKAKLSEMTSDEYLNNKVNEYSLDEKNAKIYISTLNLKDDATKIINVIDAYNKYIIDIENVLNFLKDNQANWSIKDGKIMFKKVELLDNYNSLITKQNETQSELRNVISNNNI